MTAAALALLGALVYGSADFLGGLAARRLRAIVVTATAAASGLVVLALVYPVFGGAWSAPDVMWGAISGATGAVAIGLLYACLAIGPMSILSPVTAVVSAIAPILWALLIESERLSPWGYIGLPVALVAIILVAFLPGEKIVRPSARGLLMAVGSGLAIGAFLIIIDQTSEASGIVPLLMNRLVNAAITGGIVGILVVAALRRGRRARVALTPSARPASVAPGGGADAERRGEPGAAAVTATIRRGWLLAIVCGVLDAGANVLLLLALRADGDLAVVSALTALYPAGTVLLAAMLLRERIAAVQWIGLALAVTAGALLAAA
ncbi:EamA family transporter [Microbacterium sp.]|uniref:EamA family transporter n=1 Tax=Microbacterium sp. TaxID=51671 RepID=UPI003A8677FD